MSQKKEESSLVEVSGWDWSSCSVVVLVLACDGRSVFEISLVKKKHLLWGSNPRPLA